MGQTSASNHACFNILQTEGYSVIHKSIKFDKSFRSKHKRSAYFAKLHTLSYNGGASKHPSLIFSDINRQRGVKRCPVLVIDEVVLIDDEVL